MFWYVDISFEGKKNTLGIDRGNYSGDAEKAIDAIKKFCSEHQVKIEGFRGYNTLTIEDENFDITPYGIDIEMMLGFCKIQPEAPAVTASMRR